MIQIQRGKGNTWNQTTYNYRGLKIVIQSRADSGMRAYVEDDKGIAFVQRFKWIKPDKLLTRIKSRIDMWYSGTWIPKKRRT